MLNNRLISLPATINPGTNGARARITADGRAVLAGATEDHVGHFRTNAAGGSALVELLRDPNIVRVVGPVAPGQKLYAAADGAYSTKAHGDALLIAIKPSDRFTRDGEMFIAMPLVG